MTLTAYPQLNVSPSVPAQYISAAAPAPSPVQFGKKEEPFQLSDYLDYPEISPTLWMPYFSGSSQKHKPHSLVILA